MCALYPNCIGFISRQKSIMIVKVDYKPLSYSVTVYIIHGKNDNVKSWTIDKGFGSKAIICLHVFRLDSNDLWTWHDQVLLSKV